MLYGNVYRVIEGAVRPRYSIIVETLYTLPYNVFDGILPHYNLGENKNSLQQITSINNDVYVEIRT